jgi:LmbE family N-acetylglucosaminyl deacetylase
MPTKFAQCRPRLAASVFGIFATTAFTFATGGSASAQGTTRTLVAVLAHPDDETPIGPLFVRYAREGVQVYLIIATDGGRGTNSSAAIAHPDSFPRGDDLANMRAEEARCATQALGIQPPILLGFPDGKLGDYPSDRSVVFRATDRIAAELQRLRPDAIITWGPDGGTGHPDHRLVSDIVVQLQRAGAPGVPDRVFFMSVPGEFLRAMNPQRGAPPLLAPQPKYATVRIPFTPPDLDGARRAMACHRSQFTPEVVERMFPLQVQYWNGSIALIPGFPTAGGTDLFR